MTTALAPAARRFHRPLLFTTAAMTVLALFCLCAMAIDDRQLLGESVWLKPLKFAFAFALYTGTLTWLLAFGHRGQRLTWWMGTIFAVTAVVDVGFIVTQAARGTFSHFSNEDDAWNNIGQMVFASGVPGLFAANLVIALVLSWQRVTDRPTSRAIHLGLALAVAGMALGYLMGFTGEQQATDAYGNPIPLAAGHTVITGAEQPVLRDGVDTMPITHWSTNGGDLRIPHFIGLHGIQLLIVLAVVLAKLAPRIPWLRRERARADLLGVLALGYAGLLGVVAWQALRGQPLLDPDAATATALGVVAAVTAAGIGLVHLVHGRAAADPVVLSAGVPRPASTAPMSR